MYMKNMLDTTAPVYKTNMPVYKPNKLHELRLSYIESVEGLAEYIFQYLHRNRITHETYYNYDLQGEYLLIDFKSEHQFKIFVAKINQRFPYFEVL